MSYPNRFLVEISYLGFRYHGVQIQPGYLTVAYRFEELLNAHFPEQYHYRFSSRTDAMVSSEQSYLLLMFSVDVSLEDVFNVFKKLPTDIQIKSIKKKSSDYILGNDVLEKEYSYYFHFGAEKLNAFLAPFICHIDDELNISQMQLMAQMFEGTHDFRALSFKPTEEQKTIRQISHSKIVQVNDIFGYPVENVWEFQVRGQGFLRGQVRMMMGALVSAGQNKLNSQVLKDLLKGNPTEYYAWRVPGVGLTLKRTLLKSEFSR